MINRSLGTYRDSRAFWSPAHTVDTCSCNYPVFFLHHLLTRDIAAILRVGCYSIKGQFPTSPPHSSLSGSSIPLINTLLERCTARVKCIAQEYSSTTVPSAQMLVAQSSVQHILISYFNTIAFPLYTVNEFFSATQ